MATSSTGGGGSQTNGIFNHQYRVRPTTVDQKRSLPRSTKPKISNVKRPVTTVVSNNESSAASRRRSSSRNANSSSTRVKSSGRNATFKQPTDNEIKFKTQSHLDDEEHQQQLADVENSNKLEDEITAMITMMNVNTDKNDNPDVKSDGAGSLSDIDQNDDIMNDEKWDTDIEKEEEKPKDFSCEGVYLESCKKQNIIPASYFLRHVNDQSLTMKHHGLGAPGVRPVSAALMNNSAVTKLDLSDNWLGPQGADHISRMLKENCFISELNLSDNNLSEKGCEMLKETLKANTTLVKLVLRGNKFDDKAAVMWAEVIANTIRIESLDLSANHFGEDAGRVLGPAIAENTSIKYLNLSWNNIRRKGAIAIAKGLQANSCIKRLDIGWNGFAQDGCKALFKTLKENETLEELDLTNNRIATEGCVYLAKSLTTNQTLRVLKLGQNPMESAGCFSIIKILQKNPNTKLEFIDFTDIIVDKYYRQEFKNFQTAFPHIEVKTGCDELKLKPKAKIHPVIKIRNYLEKRKLKILDFFLDYDKDGSMNVSREDFLAAIQNIGVTLTHDELEQLISELDSDNTGHINYRSAIDKMGEHDNSETPTGGSAKPTPSADRVKRDKVAFKNA